MKVAHEPGRRYCMGSYTYEPRSNRRERRDRRGFLDENLVLVAGVSRPDRCSCLTGSCPEIVHGAIAGRRDRARRERGAGYHVLGEPPGKGLIENSTISPTP